MTRQDKLERQWALIIKHHLRRCKRTGAQTREGERLPRLVAMYSKAWRKLLETGAVDMSMDIPWAFRRRVLMADTERGKVLMTRRDADLIAEIRRNAEAWS